MTKSEFIEYCLTFPDAVADCPFELDDDTVVVRHSSNRKWFALVFKLNGRQCVNLKSEPQKADFLRSAYEDVSAAWHMNHTLWSMLNLDGSLPFGIIEEMVHDSYEMTKPKKRINKTTKKTADSL